MKAPSKPQSANIYQGAISVHYTAKDKKETLQVVFRSWPVIQSEAKEPEEPDQQSE